MKYTCAIYLQIPPLSNAISDVSTQQITALKIKHCVLVGQPTQKTYKQLSIIITPRAHVPSVKKCWGHW